MRSSSSITTFVPTSTCPNARASATWKASQLARVIGVCHVDGGGPSLNRCSCARTAASTRARRGEKAFDVIDQAAPASPPPHRPPYGGQVSWGPPPPPCTRHLVPATVL